eukprot:jgi/Bigna1/129760/aug1.9_g4468
MWPTRMGELSRGVRGRSGSSTVVHGLNKPFRIGDSSAWTRRPQVIISTRASANNEDNEDVNEFGMEIDLGDLEPEDLAEEEEEEEEEEEDDMQDDSIEDIDNQVLSSDDIDQLQDMNTEEEDDPSLFEEDEYEEEEENEERSSSKSGRKSATSTTAAAAKGVSLNSQFAAEEEEEDEDDNSVFEGIEGEEDVEEEEEEEGEGGDIEDDSSLEAALLGLDEDDQGADAVGMEGDEGKDDDEENGDSSSSSKAASSASSSKSPKPKPKIKPKKSWDKRDVMRDADNNPWNDYIPNNHLWRLPDPTTTKVYNYMLEEGVRPDIVTYNELMILALKLGRMDVTLDYYFKMLDAGIEPDDTTEIATTYIERYVNTFPGQFKAKHKETGEIVPLSQVFDELNQTYLEDTAPFAPSRGPYSRAENPLLWPPLPDLQDSYDDSPDLMEYYDLDEEEEDLDENPEYRPLKIANEGLEETPKYPQPVPNVEALEPLIYDVPVVSKKGSPNAVDDWEDWDSWLENSDFPLQAPYKEIETEGENDDGYL